MYGRVIPPHHNVLRCLGLRVGLEPQDAAVEVGRGRHIGDQEKRSTLVELLGIACWNIWHCALPNTSAQLQSRHRCMLPDYITNGVFMTSSRGGWKHKLSMLTIHVILKRFCQSVKFIVQIKANRGSPEMTNRDSQRPLFPADSSRKWEMPRVFFGLPERRQY